MAKTGLVELAVVWDKKGKIGMVMFDMDNPSPTLEVGSEIKILAEVDRNNITFPFNIEEFWEHHPNEIPIKREMMRAVGVLVSHRLSSAQDVIIAIREELSEMTLNQEGYATHLLKKEERMFLDEPPPHDKLAAFYRHAAMAFLLMVLTGCSESQQTAVRKETAIRILSL